MKRCKYCGTEFKTGYKGRKIFCSNQCGVKWWNHKYKRAYKRNTKCIVCGKPIMAGSYYYCSEECKKLQAKKRALEKSSRKSYSVDDAATIDLCLNCTEKDCDGWCENIMKKG